MGGDAAAASLAVDAYRSGYRDRSLTMTTLVPGISKVLEELHGHATIMVVTSKPRVFALPILQCLGVVGWFTDVFGPALDVLTEPKAVQLAAAVKAAGVSAGQVTMVGDRHHDIDAARTVGTQSIGVTWGIGDHKELQMAGADIVLDAPTDLVSALLSRRVPQREQ